MFDVSAQKGLVVVVFCGALVYCWTLIQTKPPHEKHRTPFGRKQFASRHDKKTMHLHWS
jgi:hypothetical protein